MQQFLAVDGAPASVAYMPLSGFTAVDLGYAQGNAVSNFVNRFDEAMHTQSYIQLFDTIWSDPSRVEDVTDAICDHIASVYQENSPERVYFIMLYNIFHAFLEDIDEDVLPNDRTGYQESLVWQKLFNYQRDAATGIINKLETFNGCILADSVGFVDGEPTDYATGARSTPRRYRNSWLVQAMAELNMIDQMGYGIQRIYEAQRRRFFPLPDYDVKDPTAVSLTIHGRVVDPAYSRLLMQQAELDLVDVVNLDRVQKKLPITDDAIKHLRRRKLIEGRKPNFHVSATVAAATATMADYVRTRAQDDEFYAKLLTDYLAGAGRATRREVDQLLLDKLSDALTPEQRTKKIANLLTKLRRQGVIVNKGPRAAPQWMLAERNAR